MTTKIPVELSSTPGIVDGSNATAITIDSSENVTLSGDLTIAKATSGADSTFKVASTAASGENDATVIINSGGTGDAMLRFDYESSTDRARIGVTTSGQALQFFTAGANERMRIDSSGNVGIGETSPTANLHIKGTGDGDGVNMILHNTGNAPAGIRLLSGHGNYEVMASKTVADALEFIDDSAGVTRMLINSSGNVGIGTTSPSSLLHVDGSFSGGPIVTIHNTAGASSADRGLEVETSTTGTTVQTWKNSGSELARINGSGQLLVGTTVAPVSAVGFAVNSKISSSSQTAIEIQQNTNGANKAAAAFGVAIGNGGEGTNAADLTIHNASGGSLGERGRFFAGGGFAVGRTASTFNNDGMYVSDNSGSFIYLERSAGTSNSVLYLHRRNGDGELISFYESNSQEGSISVSGSTVSYNGFSGTHDSSGSGVSSSTAVGTVLSTIDEEHKADHAKVKVSNTASDKRVYGVLQTYKAAETNDTGNTVAEHAVVASVGIASVRVTGACAGGDLLESAGDGTARVQSDDIIRSSTLGKVTIGNSNTGEKLVSCVMYCG